MNIDVDSLMHTFFEEADEHLATFEQGLLELETAPTDREVIGRVFRAAHSIKGASGTFGLHDVARFTHGLEGLLDALRSVKITYTQELAGSLLAALDVLKELLNAARSGTPIPKAEPQVRAHLEQLLATLTGAKATVAAAVVEAQSADQTMRNLVIGFAPKSEFMCRGMDPILILRDLARAGEVLAVDLDAAAVPPIDAMDAETTYVRWTVRLRTNQTDDDLREIFSFVDDLCTATIEPEKAAIEASAAPAEAAPVAVDAAGPAEVQATHAGAPAPTIRVATDKLDKLVDLVGELVIAQAMIVDALRDPGADGSTRLQDALSAMDRNTRELQERVMSIRMVPLDVVFRRLPRIVRDVAALCGKKAVVKIEGQGTEIDKGMVEQLVDPLTHLVRNAIDHGLETPEERRAAGKPEEGTIHIRAYHQGGNVVIDVQDDGRGLPTERIREKAIRLGLVPAGVVLSAEQVNEFIFHPGFSTAEKVTDVSGRGVGMDVVKRNVEGVNGSLAITTESGKGSQVRLRLPLTLAILDGLAVRVGKQTFILPMLSVVETFRPTRTQVRGIFGMQSVMDVRGASLPIVRLNEVLGVPDGATDPCEALTCVVDANGGRLAVIVDEVVGQMQVVVKSLELNFRKVTALMGATIMGDGRVAMIVDIPALSRSSTRSSGGTERTGTASQSREETQWIQ